MKYRIVPYGADEWAIQERVLWLFWWTLAQSIGYGYSQHLTFPSEQAAEAKIADIFDYERRNREWHRRARDRKDRIGPRPFPAREEEKTSG